MPRDCDIRLDTRLPYFPPRPRLFPNLEEKIYWVRRVAPQSLQVLCDEILSPFRGYGPLSLFHKQRCLELDQDVKLGINAVNVWSRGLWKTKTISVGQTIQRILNDPDITVLLRHFDEDIASAIIADIVEHFTKNELMRLYFPEFCPPYGQEKRWCSTKSFTTPARRFKHTEPTVLGEGLNSTVTGRHFDHIHDDDVETDKSVGRNINESVREKHWAKWLDWVNLAERPSTAKVRGTYSCVGTFWHYDGILKRAQKRAQEFRFVFRIYPAYNPVTDEILCADAYPLEALNRDRAALRDNPYEFNCAILCEPNDPTAQAFRVDESLFETDRPDRRRVVRRLLSVDPSYTVTSKSDYIGMVLIEILDNDHWFIPWCERIRLESFQAVRHLIQVYKEQQPDLIYIEEIAAGKLWADLLRRLAQEAGLKLPIQSVKSHTIKGRKDNRIRMLLPRVEERRLTVLRSGHGIMDLVQEMKQWIPDATGNRDDLLDALSMAMEYAPRVHPNMGPRKFEPGTLGALNVRIEAEQSSLRGRDRLVHQRKRYGEAQRKSNEKPWVESSGIETMRR